MLGEEGSCWDLEGKVSMVPKGCGVGWVGIGLGISGLAGGSGAEAVRGGGSGSACVKILLSNCF